MREIVLYYAACPHLNAIKIGKATPRSLGTRIKALQVGNPYPIRCIGSFETTNFKAEKSLHWLLDEYRINGEWFVSEDGVMKYFYHLFNQQFIDTVNVDYPIFRPWKGGHEGYTQKNEAPLSQPFFDEFVADYIIKKGRTPRITDLTKMFMVSRMTAYLALRKVLDK